MLAVADWVDDQHLIPKERKGHPKPPTLQLAHDVMRWSRMLGGPVLPAAGGLNNQRVGLMDEMQFVLSIEDGCKSYKTVGDYPKLHDWRKANPEAARIMKLVNDARKELENAS